MKKTTALLVALALCLITSAARAATLTIDLSQPGAAMSDTLYGLFFEDINSAADGGLYAELLKNRSFENRSLPEPKVYDAFAGWMFNYRMAGSGTVTRSAGSPLSTNNPVYMHLEIASGVYNVINSGYAISQGKAGIAIDEGRDYRFSVYFRNLGFTGVITAALTDTAGTPLSNTITVAPLAQWSRHEFTFTAAATADAVLMLSFSGTGTLDMDMASLMPADAYGASWPCGGLRADLVQALKDLHPRFIRFPGGCVAEGAFHQSNFYSWKNTIGPVEQRRENENLWGYMQSYGLGFQEYFLLCEDLGAEPLPVVHAAMLCQVRDNLDTPVTGDSLKLFIQDVLDLIEYANGDVSTYWGGLRAQYGHPAPFGLKYLAIGNENWGSEYFYRYGLISRAVKDKYPGITCIAAVGPVAEGDLFEAGWKTIRSSFPGDMADEHYYMPCSWFLNHTARYDSYPRGANTVFLGEYAAHEVAVGDRRPNTLYSALCEAAYLTGIERNSDLVRMCCYAPLFAREGFTQWTPDLIWFNAREVLLTPNYYVQQMFSGALGGSLLAMSLDAPKDVFASVTAGGGKVYVKIVNVTGGDIPLDLYMAGMPDGVFRGERISGDPAAVNSFANPDKISPVAFELMISAGHAVLTLPAFSLTVLVFNTI
jgi:alpha-L-arabinofuranosidase